MEESVLFVLNTVLNDRFPGAAHRCDAEKLLHSICRSQSPASTREGVKPGQSCLLCLKQLPKRRLPPINEPIGRIAMKLRNTLLVICLVLAASSIACAQGTYPIYGIHFYSDDAAASIQNGKGMWTVEMLYTTDVHNWTTERAKLQNIKNHNFRIILRVDWRWDSCVPPTNDWGNRWQFAQDCKTIATQLGDLCECMIIGNELRDGDAITSDWYTKCFNAHDGNCVYQQVKIARPSLKVGIYAPGGWPGTENLNYWQYVVDHVYKDGNNKPQIDCFPLHGYSGETTLTNINAEDPRYGDELDFKGFVPYMRRIYSTFGASKPVYITETNTYWYFGPWDTNPRYSQDSYRSAWIKEAYQAIDEWDRSNDLKIYALCWYCYQYQCQQGCDQYENSLVRRDDNEMNIARGDYSWVTQYTNVTAGTPGTTLRFQAESYSNSDVTSGRGNANGIEGTDYHDTTTGNSGGVVRGENVDVGVTPDYSVVFVGWTAATEWLRFESLFGGYNYKIKARFARGVSGSSTVRWQVDGVTKGTLYLDDPDDNWNTYSDSALTSSFNIPAGDHIIKMIFDTGNVNIDYFEFVKQ